MDEATERALCGEASSKHMEPFLLPFRLRLPFGELSISGTDQQLLGEFSTQIEPLFALFQLRRCRGVDSTSIVEKATKEAKVDAFTVAPLATLLTPLPLREDGRDKVPDMSGIIHGENPLAFFALQKVPTHIF